jgi:hypothetical protein
MHLSGRVIQKEPWCLLDIQEMPGPSKVNMTGHWQSGTVRLSKSTWQESYQALAHLLWILWGTIHFLCFSFWSFWIERWSWLWDQFTLSNLVTLTGFHRSVSRDSWTHCGVVSWSIWAGCRFLQKQTQIQEKGKFSSWQGISFKYLLHIFLKSWLQEIFYPHLAFLACQHAWMLTMDQIGVLILLLWLIIVSNKNKSSIKYERKVILLSLFCFIFSLRIFFFDSTDMLNRQVR